MQGMQPAGMYIFMVGFVLAIGSAEQEEIKFILIQGIVSIVLMAIGAFIIYRE